MLAIQAGYTYNEIADAVRPRISPGRVGQIYHAETASGRTVTDADVPQCWRRPALGIISNSDSICEVEGAS